MTERRFVRGVARRRVLLLLSLLGAFAVFAGAASGSGVTGGGGGNGETVNCSGSGTTASRFVSGFQDISGTCLSNEGGWYVWASNGAQGAACQAYGYEANIYLSGAGSAAYSQAFCPDGTYHYSGILGSGANQSYGLTLRIRNTNAQYQWALLKK